MIGSNFRMPQVDLNLPNIDAMGGINDALAANATKKPKRGIFDDPRLSGALLRAGAATLNGGLGAGIQAGAGWMDQRRLDDEQERQWQGTHDLNRERIDVQREEANRVEPTTLQREYEYLQGLSPEQAQQFLENKVNPLKAITVGEGGVQFYRPGGASAGGGTASPGEGAPPRSGAPPVGTVKGGHRFKGGDHRDPQNWEPTGGASPEGSRTFL